MLERDSGSGAAKTIRALQEAIIVQVYPDHPSHEGRWDKWRAMDEIERLSEETLALLDEADEVFLPAVLRPGPNVGQRTHRLVPDPAPPLPSTIDGQLMEMGHAQTAPRGDAE